MNDPSPNLDPAATPVQPNDLQQYVDWLNTGRLHFQLSNLNPIPPPMWDSSVDPPVFFPPTLFTAVGFLERPPPPNDPLRHEAPGTAMSLVGDGLGITATPRAGDDHRQPNPAGITCTVVLTLGDPFGDVTLSVAVRDTTTDPPVDYHKDNINYFEVASGPASGSGWVWTPPTPGTPWISLTDGNGPYILTIAEWRTEWFTPTRTNVLGGKFLPPVPPGR